MELNPLRATQADLSALINSLMEVHGTSNHAYCASVDQADHQSFVNDLVEFADFVHMATALHGQLPGLFEHAAARTAEAVARSWLSTMIYAFVIEREYLNQLCVAVGPMPSTLGHHETTTILAQQRRALSMLVQSERRGCALAAAITLALEWQAFRKMLDAGASRLGIEPPPCKVPDSAETFAVLSDLSEPERLWRAFEFGSSQLLAQHRGMWDLLMARASARQAQD